ncbi:MULTISPECIES: peptidoglycan-binding protein [unclassified Anabaena]|uniref:peptidoglycan-binding protein n=1 Tax=unclassified Anabaena TaxID=2619674 RepID=UPI000A5D4124|nr:MULTISPECIES: peptidoglycan-binding protein [unclassified Anabaena]
MEYIAYSSMVIANEEANGQAEYIDYELPKIDWNWTKLVKSSAWLCLAGFMAFFTAIAQSQAALSAYVRTNGTCLNVRVEPNINSKVVDCLPNGTQITTMGTTNGFAKLSNNRYVAARWIRNQSSTRNPNRPNRHNTRGVGGRVNLSLGARGAAVTEVQKILGIQPTGYYGPVTARRVREFQANNNLRVDGIVGPATRTALFRTSSKPTATGGRVSLSIGSRGQAVSEVQKILGIEPTGYYGPITARRVREFQANNDLRVDGIVGPETRSALFRT